ncbi:MAG TPA: hypothetical protein VIU62_01065, partial [Chloroflexota bacterium]
HDEDRRGFRTLQTVVERLRQRDPQGERTRWRTCSEITSYACVRELATMTVDGDTISLDLPRSVPELTLRLRGTQARSISLGQQPLHEASSRAAFQTGTFYREGTDTLVAFDPPPGSRSLTLTVQGGA